MSNIKYNLWVKSLKHLQALAMGTPSGTMVGYQQLPSDFGHNPSPKPVALATARSPGGHGDLNDKCCTEAEISVSSGCCS